MFKKGICIISAFCLLFSYPVNAGAHEAGSTGSSTFNSESFQMGSTTMGSMDMGDMPLMGNINMDMESMNTGGRSMNSGNVTIDTEKLDTSGFSLNQDIDSLAKSNGMTGFGEDLDMNLDASKLMDTKSADEYFKKTLGDSYKGIDSNLSSVSMPEGINFESLNTQYANLQTEFSQNKKELSTDVTLPSFNGYSGDSTKIFKESYGDIADSLKIKSHSIPKEFNPSDMLSKMQSQKNSAFRSIKNSSPFATVSKNLTHGEIFKMAKSGINYNTLNAQTQKFGLKNIGSIKNDVGAIGGSANSKNQSSFNSSKNSFSNQNKGNTSKNQDNYVDYWKEK